METTENTPTAAAQTAADAPAAATDAAALPSARKARAPQRDNAQAQALLAQLAQWYPALFGDKPMPLKRGIYHDLLQAHPGALDAQALKAALSIHTRNGRYLNAVAQGQPRRDLGGNTVEDMAPGHVYHALLEVFRRRQRRSAEDLTPQLRRRIAQAWAASGMAAQDYAQAMRSQNVAANAVLDAALQQATAQAARDEALLRAFEASGQAEADFARAYGMPAGRAAQTLARARRLRQLQQARQGQGTQEQPAPARPAADSAVESAAD